MTQPFVLSIKNFAQIRDVSIEFGDLTVLVGAQGTGKSLALQWFKAAVDGKQIVTSLRNAGQHETRSTIIELIFGVGMGASWRSDSEIQLGGAKIRPETISRRGNGKETVFFIPAHRSMLISDGWAAPFQRLTSDTPVVARIFSQNLFDRFTARGEDQLFPLNRLLKREYRELINRAVFHGGTIALEQDQQYAKRLKLTHGDSKFPFMTWTTGQREFTPLLLGLYHVLPRTQMRKHAEIDWVIIEEPEMGLHPHAITVFLLLVLDLLWRGYRVVLSTHSPHILTAVWMLQQLKKHKANGKLVCKAFEITNRAEINKVAQEALRKTYKVHFLEFDTDEKVIAKDISQLDADSDDPAESGWGGLTGFSSRFGDVVREAVNESSEE